MGAILALVGLALAVSLGPQQLEESATTSQRQDLARKKYRVAVAAVGDNADTVAVSSAMLSHVESRLQSDASITISGQRFAKLRSELTNEGMWKYGRDTNADGVAVLKFEPSSAEEKGRVYLWTSTPSDPAPDKPTLIEMVESGSLRAEQVSRIAAVIEQAASNGLEVALELYIYTVPPRSLFTVSTSKAQSTDEKGFGSWSGTQAEGSLVLTALNEPEYEPASQQIEVQRDPSQSIMRKTIKFTLTKRPKKKKSP